MTTKHTDKSTLDNSHTVVGDSIRKAGSKIDSLSQEAADASDKALNEGMKNINKAQDNLKEYADSAFAYIEKNPLKSALIAGTAGLILGKLLSK